MLVLLFTLAMVASVANNGVDVTSGIGMYDHCQGCQDNPMGVVEISTHSTEHITQTVTHISSIPDHNDGYGYNMISITYTTHIRGINQ